MTSIDFHFNTPNRLEYACRLTRKILNAGQAKVESPLVVFCSERSRLDHFDDLLWSRGQRNLFLTPMSLCPKPKTPPSC
jgi:DNA polymerase-3 subunit chi